ncbi:MAG: hypothetical protein A2Z04_07560 [Chloroflexi bacterium RBG_16_57_9]|nr:MAG: hypothetical protein A2Z04_07560 [Chloroflexi bacterium RBG_16_57_9]
MPDQTIISIFNRINLVVASANVIVTFSLLAYLLTHNFRNSVARAFSAVLAFATVVYAGAILVSTVDGIAEAQFWLKFRWLGIAFVPAAYLHFSDALLQTTHELSKRRRWAVRLGYLVGLIFLVLVLTGDRVVHDLVLTPSAAYLKPGPLFTGYVIYFFFASGWGALNIYRAWRRCLTPTSRRRMSYLFVSLAAPLSVFPYLIATSPITDLRGHPIIFSFLATLANLGSSLMAVVVTYGVAYHGVLTPDRVVKRGLIKYLIQGPVLGSCVIGLMLLVPPVERILGLPRDTVLIFAVVGGIVMFQIIIMLSKPLVDLIVYWGDWSELKWMRSLDERLLTSTDLTQLLENILTALCDRLRAETGFVAVATDGGLRLDTSCGSRSAVNACLAQFDLSALAALDLAQNGQTTEGEFVRRDGFWLLPLRGGVQRRQTSGLLGIQAINEELFQSEAEREGVAALIERAEMALEDRRLQQGVFGVLKHLQSEIETLQRVRGAQLYAGAPPLEMLAGDNPILSLDFASWVKDALSHYWGGPRLTESPLLHLQIVRDKLEENDYNAGRAVRSILDQAITALRPSGERSLTASEWVLYNILELHFIKGDRVRDIARRLAISESDLYRKQRVAIDEVARQLALMEEQQKE